MQTITVVFDEKAGDDGIYTASLTIEGVGTFSGTGPLLSDAVRRLSQGLELEGV